MKRLVLLCFGLLALGGQAVTAEAGDAAHCRVYFDDGRMAKEKTPVDVFEIRNSTLADFASLHLHDYEIGARRHGSGFPGARIAFQPGDRVELALDTQGLLLLHRRAGSVIGSASLSLDAWGLWAVGDAYDGDGRRVGYYYAFRQPDALQCGHSNAELLAGGTPAPCRRLRLEYFDDNDRTVDDHHPLALRGHRAQNVFAIDDARCTAVGIKQTDDGDGDEGLR